MSAQVKKKLFVFKHLLGRFRRVDHHSPEYLSEVRGWAETSPPRLSLKIYLLSLPKEARPSMCGYIASHYPQEELSPELLKTLTQDMRSLSSVMSESVMFSPQCEIYLLERLKKTVPSIKAGNPGLLEDRNRLNLLSSLASRLEIQLVKEESPRLESYLLGELAHACNLDPQYEASVGKRLWHATIAYVLATSNKLPKEHVISSFQIFEDSDPMSSIMTFDPDWFYEKLFSVLPADSPEWLPIARRELKKKPKSVFVVMIAEYSSMVRADPVCRREIWKLARRESPGLWIYLAKEASTREIEQIFKHITTPKHRQTLLTDPAATWRLSPDHPIIKECLSSPERKARLAALRRMTELS